MSTELSLDRKLATAQPREWHFIALSAALSIMSFALLWYQAYGLNQAIQLAYVNHWVDPTLYPRDPFPPTGLYYISLFWKGIAALTAIVPLRSILLGGMVLERFLSIYSAGRIARSLVGPSMLARVAAMSIMTIGPVALLGAGTTMPNYFEQSGLAMAVLLLSFSFFLDRRYIAWGVLVGLAANLNALYAAYAVGYCAVMFFIERRPLKEFPKLAIAGMSMLLFGSPLLIFIYHLPPQHPFNHQLWWQAMQVRSSHHLMPLTWPAIRYAEFASTIVLLLMIAWLMRRETTSKLSRFAVAVAIASVACVAAAFFVAYAIHIPRLLTLQPIRGTDLGYCLTDIVFACAAALWFERSAANATRAIAILPVVLLACLWPLLPIAAIAIAMVAGIGIYLLMTWATKTTTTARRIRFATIACLISLCVAAIARPTLTWQYTIFNTGNRWPVAAAAEWASLATPKDALFLLDAIDDRTEPFRALSRRSVFVHVKDGTVLFTDMDYLSTWRARMQLAGYPLDSAPRYPQWRDADAISLHKNVGVDYWLVAHDLPSSLPVVWQDKTFKILDLDR